MRYDVHRHLLPRCACCYESGINNKIVYFLFSALFTWGTYMVRTFFCRARHFPGKCVDRLSERQKNGPRVCAECSYQVIIEQASQWWANLKATPTITYVYNILFHPSHIPPTGILCSIFLMTLNHFIFDHYLAERIPKAAILGAPIDPFR